MRWISKKIGQASRNHEALDKFKNNIKNTMMHPGIRTDSQADSSSSSSDDAKFKDFVKKKAERGRKMLLGG